MSLLHEPKRLTMIRAAISLDPDALLKEEQAADILNHPVRTLQAWRLRNVGPAYVRTGRSVRYRRRDLTAWIDANTVTPTKPASQEVS